MIRELIYIVEIFSVLKCIHCVYGEKQKINAVYVMTVISLFVTVEIANRKSIELEGTFLMYTILSIYCILTFKKTAKIVVINTALYMIISTLLQLIFGGVVTAIFDGDILLRTLIADINVLVFCAFILPFLKLDKFALWASRKGYTLYISIGYVFLIICILLLRIKVNGGVRVGTYLTLIPFIFCFYILSKEWRLYQDSYEQEKRELQLYKEDKRKFGNMVTTVRSRQHEINNHITAIMSLHYTAETYEDLVEMQNQYCKHIMEENKFHSLLRLYNSILPGYLIEKFSQIEAKGITVECKIFVEQYESLIPEYYLVEMLGILLDNAAEAIEESTFDKNLYFAIAQLESGYEYVVRNPHEYVPFEEFDSWFVYEKSSKGSDRGIGLYHLKGLCNEWRCSIIYGNVKIDDLNWIEFKVRTGRSK